jgi:beta-N-acetylhexosaminidase
VTPWRRRLAVLAAVGAGTGGVIALATEPGPPARTPLVPAGGSGFRPPGRTVVPSAGPAPARDPGDRRRAQAIDRSLPVPLDRAAARLFLVGFAGTTRDTAFLDPLRSREWGAVLIDRANVVDARQLRTLTRRIGAVARGAGHLAPVLAAPQLGGAELALPAAGPQRQGLVSDPAVARAQAQRAGRALQRFGIDLTLAPSADLALAGGPWEQRAFGGEPADASRLVSAAIAGWRAAGVSPVIGHFPGEGAASQDPELGVGSVGEGRADLRARDEAPFVAAAGSVDAIQLSGALFAAFDGVTPATLDPAIVAELRSRRFRGAIVSANLTAATLATGRSVGDAAVAALAAGCDVLYVPGDKTAQEEAYRAVVQAVRAGRIAPARVRDALQHAALLRR